MARHFLPDRHYLPGRWTTSVSTQSIRFVSIHPIATDIATVARFSSILNITRNFLYESSIIAMITLLDTTYFEA